MKRIISIFLVAIVPMLTAFHPGVSSQKFDTNAKIKAVFIYNFMKYIEWPKEYNSGEITINILGDNQAIYEELTKMSKVKKISNQSFSVYKIDSPGNVGNPHILYIPEDSTEQLSQALANLEGKSTLIITEAPGLAKKGAAINFIVQGNRQKYELNKTNLESRDLKVASVLEQLAVLVN